VFVLALSKGFAINLQLLGADAGEPGVEESRVRGAPVHA
jgi:hypothetical protein